MSRFALSLLLLGLAIALHPDAAAACSVCYGGAEESRKAFLFTTILLSGLPVGMMCGLGWWVWRRAREADAELPQSGDPSGGSSRSELPSQ